MDPQTGKISATSSAPTPPSAVVTACTAPPGTVAGTAAAADSH